MHCGGLRTDKARDDKQLKPLQLHKKVLIPRKPSSKAKGKTPAVIDFNFSFEFRKFKRQPGFGRLTRYASLGPTCKPYSTGCIDSRNSFTAFCRRSGDFTLHKVTSATVPGLGSGKIYEFTAFKSSSSSATTDPAIYIWEGPNGAIRYSFDQKDWKKIPTSGALNLLFASKIKSVFRRAKFATAHYLIKNEKFECLSVKPARLMGRRGHIFEFTDSKNLRPLFIFVSNGTPRTYHFSTGQRMAGALVWSNTLSTPSGWSRAKLNRALTKLASSCSTALKPKTDARVLKTALKVLGPQGFAKRSHVKNIVGRTTTEQYYVKRDVKSGYKVFRIYYTKTFYKPGSKRIAANELTVRRYYKIVIKTRRHDGKTVFVASRYKNGSWMGRIGKPLVFKPASPTALAMVQRYKQHVRGSSPAVYVGRRH